MKKTLAILLIVSLVSMLAIGSTYAYLQDSDADKNVMTVGNVHIVQNETDRNGNPFQDNQKLLPAVLDASKLAMTERIPAGPADAGEAKLWQDDAINNEIDKLVSVTNTGTESAYIRTIFAFETRRHYKENSDTEFTDLQDVYIGYNGSFTLLNRYITIDGIEYALAVYVYQGEDGDGIIAPQAITETSLRQIFLSPDAGNEFYDIFGSEFDILCLSQAVQSQGFSSAEQALNAAFGILAGEGAVDDATLISWFAGIN